ncbi:MULTISPECIES: hypothetical protein [unclassified Hydrogenophaga]|uniref:hypothetical protein n=1 Tax=unclassified Hydrogenophaga TaxID=2610897 RepID=UPI000B09534E|nr:MULTISPECIES: hypothetical protein [unclassified Hydrogenophaga]MBN9373542.1 hypothetical protein [Hydrogenophaga sp.]
MSREMKRALRNETIAVHRPLYDSEIVAGSTAEQQAEAARLWVDQLAAMIQRQGELFFTCLDFRFTTQEGALSVELVCREVAQQSLMPMLLEGNICLSGDEVFAKEVAEWRLRLRAICQDHEIAIIDRPVVSTAARRMTNDPTRGLVPIATADDISRATEAVLPPSMEKVEIDGERFELADRGASDIPVWSQPCAIRGIPSLNRMGFLLHLITSTPMQPSGGRLLLRLVDLTREESARLVQHAHSRTPLEMLVAIARGKGRTLLGAPAREVSSG